MRKNKNKKHAQKKVRLSAFLLTGAALAAAQPAGAQTFSCATGIVFGDFMACSSTQSVTVTPGNSRTTSDPCLSPGGAPYNRGICVFTNFTASNWQFSITATKHYMSNGTGAKMTVDNYQCRFQGDLGTVTNACNYTASPFFATIQIGADLTVSGSQSPGTYNGTFTVQSNLP